MIYFDAAYIVKCYLPESGYAPVRALLHRSHSAACCAFGRVEFAAAIQRAIREGRLPEAAKATIASQLARDDEGGVWSWLPVTQRLLDAATRALQSVPIAVPIRAADALHLVCARENGYREVYTNDRQLLAAAPHFGVLAVNVIP